MPSVFDSPQPKDFVGQAGRIRLPPLETAMANNVAKTSPALTVPAAAGSQGNGSGSSFSPVSATATPNDPNVVADKVAKAESGDPDAINWLTAAGLVGLIGGGALAATYYAKKHGNEGMQGIGAHDIANDAAPVKALPAPTATLLPNNTTSPQLMRPGAIYADAPAETKLLPKSTTIYQSSPPQPLMITDQNASGRARAEAAEREGWEKRLSDKFKVKRTPGRGVRAITRAIR